MPLDHTAAASLSLLEAPTRNLFITGKGGMGKTTIAGGRALARIAAAGVATTPARPPAG